MVHRYDRKARLRVRSEGSDLLASFVVFLFLRRQEIVGQFAVLNVQFFILTKEFRPLLRHFVVHPNSVNAEVAAGEF